MRAAWIALTVLLAARGLVAEPGETLRVEYSNPGLKPATWTLVLHDDGSAHFHSDGEGAPLGGIEIAPGPVDRDFRVSTAFAGRIFGTVHSRGDLRDVKCESHMKVAFQGWKKLAYTGPAGNGGCEFNYSKDKDVQALGESFVAVAATVLEGARLELLLQHDRLGLDQEMQFIEEGMSDGRLQQAGAIRETLEKLENDPGVMERVRRRAHQLLTRWDK